MLHLLIAFAAHSASALSRVGDIHLRDYRSLTSLSSVQLSPDGTEIALVKSVPNFATDTRQAALVLVDRKTCAIQTLTDGKDTL
jgi:hypothetical protein